MLWEIKGSQTLLRGPEIKPSQRKEGITDKQYIGDCCSIFISGKSV